MLADVALIFVPPAVYWALSWALRPAAVLAVCVAPLAWAFLGFAGALMYFGPGGTLPQVSFFLALIAAGVVAFGAFIAALALLSLDRHLATPVAVANGLAWMAPFVLALVSGR